MVISTKTDKTKDTEKIPLTFLEILREKIQKMEGDISPREQNLLFRNTFSEISSNIIMYVQIGN
jgi:hypothetical protein